MSVLDLGVEPAVSLGLGRPPRKPVVSAGLGRPGLSFTESVAVDVAVRGWKLNRWNGCTSWFWVMYDAIAEAAEVGMRVAKLLLRTVANLLWRALCEVALRGEAGRPTVKVTINQSPGAKCIFAKCVFIYTGDHGTLQRPQPSGEHRT